MTFYRYIKWGAFMFAGCFACYHGASLAASAAFIMAGIQPCLCKLENRA